MKGIVTGYSSGIGKAICEKLESCGYEIIKLQSRFEDTQNLEKEVKEILKTTEIDFLINCAGKGVFEPHEEINPKKIEELIAINLTAPILLANLVLRSLKKTKGNIINIASIEATRHSKFSALYTATKSGLRDFSLSLFEEVRKSGVKVTSINPDMTMTPFFDELKFKPSSKEENHLLSSEVADVVYEVLTSKIAITDITLRSQYFGIEKK
ncbi:MAG: SDR family NAD(P)-dependent oxidoreductase [Arcobacteraceae bacterium]|nr:SDR family NAD(P)-dependent oxidoreductase [Arcobacteraceae bacterium]